MLNPTAQYLLIRYTIFARTSRIPSSFEDGGFALSREPSHILNTSSYYAIIQ